MTTLSLTGKRWRVESDLRETTPDHIASHVAQRRGIDPLVVAPLPFSTPNSVPPDLERVVERVRRALRNGERIALFGDYDCDGITAVAQVLRSLRRHGGDPFVRLPHRQQEGYGLKEAMVRTFAEAGVTLLITLDTGIMAHAEIEAGRACGMDVIIVDHHHLPPQLPQAYGILHPGLAQEGGAHPSAAGAAFGLVSALEGGSWEDRDMDLALAMIGTVADLVELRGTNRRMVQEGIRAFHRLPPSNPLRILAGYARLQGAPTSRDIAFRIAPRLNAAGRMDDPAIALRALLGDATSLAHLERLNQERQDQTRTILAGIRPDLSASFIIVASPEYPAGILGLIAGKLTESYGRPSMAAQIQGDMCVASLRSIPGFHVAEALQSCASLLQSYGGHAQAAGCTFRTADLPLLSTYLLEHATQTITAESLIPQLSVDGILSPAQITLDLCASLQHLEPHGQGNAEPRFLLPAVQFSSLKRVGREYAHLQGTIGTLKAVGFHLGAQFERLPTGPVDVACRVSVDTWNGTAAPQLIVEDIRVAMPAHAEKATA